LAPGEKPEPLVEDSDGNIIPPCFDETNCLLCGQCLASCPVAALQEKDHITRVEEALANEQKHPIIAIAPAVRAALGEEFGLPIGTDVTGKIYTALRELGFKKVFDINFAADVTIMEEGTELLHRLGIDLNIDFETGEITTTPAPEGISDKLPMYTSCCPGWVRQIRNYLPDQVGNLSSAKSPQQIFGAASKIYYPMLPEAVNADGSAVQAEDVYMVTVMPCIAKKAEAAIDGIDASDDKDIDAVLTTRELARMIRARKIDFVNLEDSEADQAMGEYSGAGTIFGTTGGVMEAAIRSARALALGKDAEHAPLDYETVRGLAGVKEAEVQIGDLTLKVAVVNGAANFFDLQAEGKLQNYHFIEVMACAGGCVGGGGQPIINAKDRLDYIKDGEHGHPDQYLQDIRMKRASVLYRQDKEGIVAKHRMSHENEAVLEMYRVLKTHPGHGLAHKIFHHTY
jgi:iron-only hydrogenase group A